ncbi:MAG: PAS domain-containing protein [Myxococcales bacterium]|nr:PAS domain-containing protein [Myxococcales bacterium]
MALDSQPAGDARGDSPLSLEEFSSYVEFGDDDRALLRALWPHVEPRRDAIIADFYDRITRHPSTRAIVSDPASIQRLMRTLRVWLEELLLGPWDEAYVQRRRRIGRVHSQVGVDHAAMFMAMSAVQSRLCEIANASSPEPCATVSAVRKVTNLDLGLMTSSYHTLQQERRVRDVQAILVAHLPAIALLIDATGVVQSATPAADWLCCRPIEPGLHFTQLLDPSLVAAAELEHYVTRALSTRNDVHLPRVDTTQSDEPRTLSLTLVPFDSPAPGVLVYIEDHTHAVNAERRFQQQERLAQVGTMSATIAHELRNPLAGISGALQVIAGGLPEGDRRAPILAKVLDQVRGLNRMVTDLLAYSKPHASRVESGIDLVALVNGVASDVVADYPSVQIEVAGEAVVSVDPHMARQVLHNLVMNAAQAAGDGGHVQVTVGPHSVRVCDSGPGLPDAVRPRVFEPFFTTKIKGTGLGLPISQKIARAMGGDLLIIDGGPLAGACFDFLLGR